MTQSTDLTIDHDIMIEAPIETVWRTITTPDQISLWFAEIKELDLRPGGEGTFTFTDTPSHEEVVAPLQVETVDPPNEFSFRWAHPEGEQPTAGRSVLVTLSLEARGDARTRLRLVETGLDTIHWDDADKANYATGHNEGWTKHLGRLVGLFAAAGGAAGGAAADGSGAHADDHRGRPSA